MEYRRLGKSGLQLSVLSFGSWVTFHGQVDDSLSDQLMGVAYDNGINFFDNAEIYALGESEKMMGRVLKKKNWDRSSYIISSKAYFGWRGEKNKPNQTGLSRKHLVEACHEALERLQLSYLDIFYCHRPDRNVPMEEVVWTMNILIQQGKILYWGTSEWAASEIMEAHMIAKQNNLIGPVVEQPEYNLFRREKVELEYARIYETVGLGNTIFSPLASGILTGKYNNGIPEGSRLGLQGYEWLKNRNLLDANLARVAKLQSVSDKLGTSLATLSIAWVIKNQHVTSAILGATKEAQLTENLKALEVYTQLTPELMKEIDAIMGTAPNAPTH
ncbi:potassium channel beta subunit family protein [Chitinophaga niabensis]|uniref:Voltage-dependent potassium channel beta subunit, animal n=1 Tax=Chitinophaga niabensis TaxID=536979 RepID=A0A1N6JVU3_9BACT|nr:aldo/keto reductase [Chitinophaga niabensis]SIO48339.1 voltage-dependent potassium channel beta subunit, animal [Chitinophaga niabensis]